MEEEGRRDGWKERRMGGGIVEEGDERREGLEGGMNGRKGEIGKEERREGESEDRKRE